METLYTDDTFNQPSKLQLEEAGWTPNERGRKGLFEGGVSSETPIWDWQEDVPQPQKHHNECNVTGFRTAERGIRMPFSCFPGQQCRCMARVQWPKNIKTIRRRYNFRRAVNSFDPAARSQQPDKPVWNPLESPRSIQISNSVFTKTESAGRRLTAGEP